MLVDLTRFSLRLLRDALRLSRCSVGLRLSCRFEFHSSVRLRRLLGSGRLFLFLHIAGADRRHAFPTPLRLALCSSRAPELLHDTCHLAVYHRVRPVPAQLPRAWLAALITTGQRLPERIDVKDTARLVLAATFALALRVERGTKHAARILIWSVVFLITDYARRDDEELGGNELEAGS